MARELKQLICEDLKARFQDMDGCVLIDFRGLSAEVTEDLRSTLRQQGVQMNVVRNRLAQRVFSEIGLDDEFNTLLTGPIAVLMGGEGAFTASRGIVNWRKKNKEVAEIRGGFFQGRVLQPADIERLAAIPEPEVLRQQVMSQFLAPLTHMSSCAKSLTAHFAGCVKAHHDAQDG